MEVLQLLVILELSDSHGEKALQIKIPDGGRAAEVVQQLRVLDVLVEDLGLVPSIHMAAHNHLQFQFHGIQCPLLSSLDTRPSCSIHIHMQAKHPNT